jgi:hypothetical protein
VTNESTREIDRLCARLNQAEDEVQRLKTALMEIAEYREIAWATVGVAHALAIKFCRIASEALEFKD